MLGKLIAKYCQLLSWLMAASLALMVVLVFTNVVLRYALNSGIAVSEELSRWLFVWMTFMGAIVALREHGHLGTDMLVARLSVRGKRAVLGLAYVLMLLVIATGIYGVIVYATLPQSLSANRKEMTRKQMLDAGSEPVGNTTEQMAAQIRAELDGFDAVVKQIKLVVDFLTFSKESL